jgi:sugar O-acyltransferase (sialic acid O-acetyltransferase NeuD family)
MTNLIIYGAGEVAKFIALNLDLFEGEYQLLGMVDDDQAKVATRVCDVLVWSRDRLDKMALEGVAVVIAIGAPGAKEYIAGELEPRGVVFPNFIARGVWISKGVEFGRGVIVYPGCTVEHETTIGDFVIVNAGCTVGHGVRIGDFATISPGVHLAGGTVVGDGAYLGIGCCTRQNVTIGARSVVGGQAMVVNDVPPEKLAIGVPATTR